MYCQRQSNTLINKIHERALRIAYNNYVSSFETLLEKDGSLSIHQRNIQSLTIEIFKTNNDLNPTFHNYNTRRDNLYLPNPRTVAYGLETLGYRANQIWNTIPNEIKSVKDIDTFKILLSKNNTNLCTCNLCKEYIPNIGYI